MNDARVLHIRVETSQLPMERELPGASSTASGAEGSSACPVIGSGSNGGMQTAGLLQQVRSWAVLRMFALPTVQ